MIQSVSSQCGLTHMFYCELLWHAFCTGEHACVFVEWTHATCLFLQQTLKTRLFILWTYTICLYCWLKQTVMQTPMTSQLVLQAHTSFLCVLWTHMTNQFELRTHGTFLLLLQAHKLCFSVLGICFYHRLTYHICLYGTFMLHISLHCRNIHQLLLFQTHVPCC